MSLAMGVLPGEMVRHIATVGAPLSRYGGRTPMTAMALSRALQVLAQPPRPLKLPDGYTSLAAIARLVGRSAAEVGGWAKDGYLGPPKVPGTKQKWGRDAIERARLVDYLLRQGVDERELRSAAGEDRIAQLVLARALTGQGRLTLSDLAEQSRLPVAFLSGTWRAMGLPEPEPEEKVYNSGDVEALRLLGALRGVFTDDDLLEVTSVVGRAMGEVAEAALELFRRRLAQPFADAGVGELEMMVRLAAVIDMLVPSTATLLEITLKRHLEAIGQAETILQVEHASGGNLGGQLLLSIGFADLVGFTRLTSGMTPLQTSQVAASLVRCAEETLPAHGGRIVKGIGDAVMFSHRDLVSACQGALALQQAVKDHPGLPELRIGIAHGPVLRAYADLFGGTVNLANRLCEAAPIGGVLVADAGVDAPDWAGAGLRVGPRREHRLDGIGHRVGARLVTLAPG
ncbi:MAG: adenylate/guanylate cyclase domain-containing protein [Candidatus Dormibacteria bacterium]